MDGMTRHISLLLSKWWVPHWITRVDSIKVPDKQMWLAPQRAEYVEDGLNFRRAMVGIRRHTPMYQVGSKQ